MAKRKISERISVDFGSSNPEWTRIRNSAGMDAYLKQVAAETIARANADLRAAQAKRKQPVEDGYSHNITHGSRSRLILYPDTPRAIAHEAVNQSLLKNLPIGGVKNVRPPDHEVPRELAALSNEAQARKRARANLDAQGNEIHNL